MKIDALKNFAKFTEKHLSQCLFFNKIVDLGQQNTFFTEHLPNFSHRLLFSNGNFTHELFIARVSGKNLGNRFNFKQQGTIAQQ